MEEKQQSRPGIGVDSRGGAVIDPTQNVKDLSIAANQRQDDLRGKSEQYYDMQIKSLVLLFETFQKHTEDKAQIREAHAKEIRLLESDRLDKIRQVDVLAVNTAADRTLAAVQTLANTTTANAQTLRDMVASTAQTIANQTASTVSAINERISQLEKSSYEGRGRSTVSDPQYAKAVEELQMLRELQARGMGATTGRGALWAYIVGGIGLLMSLATIVKLFIAK
jgi:hypothetical protein